MPVSRFKVASYETAFIFQAFAAMSFGMFVYDIFLMQAKVLLSAAVVSLPCTPGMQLIIPERLHSSGLILLFIFFLAAMTTYI